MSILHVGAEERTRIENLRRFAEDRAHWFRPGEDDWTPGDMPEYVVTISGFRCVFTWSVHTGGAMVYRHLSVSSPRASAGMLPTPYSLWWLASLFGFTGFDPDDPGKYVAGVPEGWQAHIDKKAPIPNVVAVQQVEGVTA